MKSYGLQVKVYEAAQTAKCRVCIKATVNYFNCQCNPLHCIKVLPLPSVVLGALFKYYRKTLLNNLSVQLNFDAKRSDWLSNINCTCEFNHPIHACMSNSSSLSIRSLILILILVCVVASTWRITTGY